jgi:hypothetical protein
VYAGVPAVLLYFGVVAVMLGFLATTQSGASWRDTVARLAAVPFLAAVACAALIEGPKSPLVRIPTSPLDAPTLYWLFLAALVLALVMAVLGRGEAAPAASRRLPLTVDLCVFAVPSLAATFADQNGFTLDARAWVALAVTAIGIALLWTLQAPDAERVDGPREPEPAQG